MTEENTWNMEEAGQGQTAEERTRKGRAPEEESAKQGENNQRSRKIRIRLHLEAKEKNWGKTRIFNKTRIEETIGLGKEEEAQWTAFPIRWS